MTQFRNISVDPTLGGNSPDDYTVSSQKAIKTYVDTTAVTHTASTAVGNSTTPVYVESNGTATALSYTIEKSVPSNAEFTDTTYSAGTGLSLSGTTINHSNSVTAGTAGTSSETSGSTLDVPYITYDAQGHITATGTHTHTVSGFLTSSDVDQTYSGVSTNPQSGVAVKSAIDNALTSVYKAAGSIAFANLPTPASTNEGYVYNVTDAFTTDSRFVEGSGKDYPAGTNVVIINTSGTTYMFDVLSGLVDLSGYQVKLVSGTNIKTVNNTSLLGSGNISITGLPSQTGQSGKFLTTNGSSASWSTVPSGSTTLADLTDTTITTPTSGQVLKYNGSSWVNGTVDSLPSQTGNAGKSLVTDGTDASWAFPIADGLNNKNTASGATSTIYDWVGTLSEYQTQAVATNHPEWVCYITDDISGGDSVYTKTEVNSLVSQSISTVLSILYPVGSTYMGTQGDCPMSALIPNSSWQLITATIITEVSNTASVAGNGKVLGLTNGTDTGCLTSESNHSYNPLIANSINVNVGTVTGNEVGWTQKRAIGVTTNASQSGLTATVTKTSISVRIWKRTA